MVETGYIKLFRSMLTWEWFSDANTLSVFIFCLLSANHKPNKWRGITIGSGQFVTSLHTIATKTGLTVRSVRTSINHLISTGEVTSKATNKYSLITIVNWASYQSDLSESTSKTTSNLTNDRQATDKQPTTNKNDKKERSNLFGQFWSRYPKKKAKADAEKAFNKIDVNDHLLNKIIDSLDKAIVSDEWKKNGGQFIPYPATWLNGRRWEDETDTTVGSAYPDIGELMNGS